MGLDIRLPIGMMFSLLGALLAIYGLATGGDSDMYKSSLDLNVNFWWGLVLFLFAFAVRTARKERSPSDKA
jgi:hypothetical protein